MNFVSLNSTFQGFLLHGGNMQVNVAILAQQWLMFIGPHFHVSARTIEHG